MTDKQKNGSNEGCVALLSPVPLISPPLHHRVYDFFSTPHVYCTLCVQSEVVVCATPQGSLGEVRARGKATTQPQYHMT